MYSVVLKVDQACNWYNASVGAYISIYCSTPAAIPQLCIPAKIVNVSCAFVGGVTLVREVTVSSDSIAILKLTGHTISTVAPMVTDSTKVQITSILYSTFMAINSILEEKP